MAPMRLISRNDTSLAVGLIIGAIVVFQQPLHVFLDIARDLELRYHVDLIPALTIMSGVFIFHQYRKRQIGKAEALAAAADAVRARARSEELERLVAFSQALANVLDLSTLQQVLWRYLPAFACEHDCWVLCRVGHRWQAVLQSTGRTPPHSIEALESMANDAVADDTRSEAWLHGAGDATSICLPMFAGGVAVGVLGIHDGTTIPANDRRALGAAAALIAIALKNVRMFEDTRDQSVRDGLTGCFNREHALTTLDGELRRAKRSGDPLAILMFDIDRFKTINDELGHLQGDAILRALGAQLTRVLRVTDVRCRYGGDEFLVVLPGTRVDGATLVAENLRREVSALTVPSGDRVLTVSISIGVTAAAPDELDVTALLARADEALYEAKRTGRNRTCVAAPPDVVAPATTRAHLVARQTPPNPAEGTETILVVEDEPLILEQIRRALEPRGYTLLLAGSANDAIAIEASHRGPIQLLLTDVIMPDVNGPDLARQIRGRRPAIEVLYVSGFLAHDAADPAFLGADAAFLPKPFTAREVAAKIRQLLDARASTTRSHAPAAHNTPKTTYATRFGV